MTTNYAKMSTAILTKKLSAVKGQEKKAIQAVLNNRNSKAPKGDLKGKKIYFVTRTGQEISGEVVTTLVGKRDRKIYYGVKHDGKMYYKQQQSVALV
jgi:hypothetical protein